MTAISGEARALRVLAEALAFHRCGPCDGHDPHEVCTQPDWNAIGRQMLTIVASAWGRE